MNTAIPTRNNVVLGTSSVLIEMVLVQPIIIGVVVVAGPA